MGRPAAAGYSKLANNSVNGILAEFSHGFVDLDAATTNVEPPSAERIERASPGESGNACGLKIANLSNPFFCFGEREHLRPGRKKLLEVVVIVAQQNAICTIIDFRVFFAILRYNPAMDFQLVTSYKPKGDRPRSIKQLLDGLAGGEQHEGDGQIADDRSSADPGRFRSQSCTESNL
jgi:hypothetical protein